MKTKQKPHKPKTREKGIKRKEESKNGQSKKVRKMTSKRYEKIKQLETISKEANKLTSQILLKPEKKLKAHTKPNQEQLVKDLRKLLQQNLTDLSMKHDSNRSIQTLYKFSNPQQKREILDKLDYSRTIPELSKGKYSSFTVVTFLKHSTVEETVNLLKFIEKDFVSLSTHATAGNVIETIFKLEKSLKFSRNEMKEIKIILDRVWLKLLGGNLALVNEEVRQNLIFMFKGRKVDLEKDIKEKMFSSLKRNILKMIAKGLAKYEFVHRIFWIYLKNEKEENFFEELNDPFLLFALSSDGVKVLCKTITKLSPKEKKKWCKKFSEENIFQGICHEHCFLVILSLICCTDDIILLKKVFLKPFFNLKNQELKVESILMDKNALKFLSILFDYESKNKVLQKEEIEFLKGETTKKDVEQKLSELIAEDFIELFLEKVNQEFCNENLTTKEGSNFLLSLFKAAKEKDVKNLYQKLKYISGIFIETPKLFEDNFCHRFLKDLILKTKNKEICVEIFQALKDRKDSFSNNRICFILAAIVKISTDNKILKQIRNAIKKSKETNAGIQAIKNELKAKST
eukprot:snap_masked-scaffold_79-processed-gene-0.32-mRNA-1 protein AED:1.00 eAED:1.00 QI:0/-1/0/0/-1/1/1/0/571